MGGQGKTQIALQFCQRACYPDTGSRCYRAIFWVDAYSGVTIRKGFQAIYAAITKDQQVRLNEDEQIRYVKGFLQSWKAPWLIVFDNYDNPPGFTKIREFMPISKREEFLITSRHEDAKQYGVEIKIPGLSENKAIRLLITQSGEEKTEKARKEAQAIVKELEYLALAIHQAGGYAYKHPPLSSFLSSFKTKRAKVMDWTPTSWQYTRDTSGDEQERVLSVLKTWELFLENLKLDMATREKVEQFITVCSYLDVRDISESLIKASFYDLNSWINLFVGPDGQWNNDAFQEVLIKLRELALIQGYSAEEKSFSLHPLVSEWLKYQAKEEDQKKDQKKKRHLNCLSAARLINNYLRAASKNSSLGYLSLPRKVRQSILLHITSCKGEIKKFPALDSSLDEMDEVCYCFAEFHDSVGNYSSAQILQEEMVRRREKKLKKGNPHLLASQSFLARIYHYQGNFEKAEILLRKALNLEVDLEGEALKRGDPVALKIADYLVSALAY